MSRHQKGTIIDMSRHVRFFATALLGGSLIAGCTTVEEDFSLSVGRTQAPLLAAEGARPGEYIVVLQSTVEAQSQLAATASRVSQRDDGSGVLYNYSILPAFAAKLSPAAVAELRADPNVAYIEENGRVSAVTVHDVGSGPDGLDRVDQRQLPRDGQYDDHDQTGAGVHVYIVDTGLNTSHNEFTGRIGSLADFIGDGQNGEDCNGHGSHVGSTVAGTQFGLAKAATLHGVRVLDCAGSGSFASVIAGVDHVRNDCPTRGGACVANMSLGGGLSQSLNNAVANAVASGVPFAVAAGNESSDACTRSPASEPSAFTVAALADNDDHASFSNFGSCVDIYAPGVSILGANIGGPNATMSISGTSMASPHVAGAVAQFLGVNPSAGVGQTLTAMLNSATPNCVAGAPANTANLVLFNDFGQSGADQGCSGEPPPPGDPNSCEGFCGGQAPGGCFCDAACKRLGDCCADKRRVCGRN
jgi:subtilisin family serine protease